jgi:long-chain acyl-CoA synthetase
MEHAYGANMTSTLSLPLPPLPLPPLSQRMRDVCLIDPLRTAIEFNDRSYSWGYLANANQTLDALCENVGGRGRHRVGVVLRNRPEHAAAVVATIATGRCLITLSAHHGPIMLLEDMREYQPSVVIASTEDWAIPGFVEAVQEIGALGLEAHEDAPALRLASACPVAVEVRTEPEDGVAVLMMTSGTTGRPKRVPLTYEKLTSSFEASGLSAGPSAPLMLRDDTPILWTAFVHIGGLYFILAQTLAGNTTALLERFEVSAWASLVQKYKPHIVSLVPAAIRMVLDANVPASVFEGVHGVRSGTAPLEPEVADEFLRRYGIPVLMNYGATEFAGAVTRWTLKDHERYGAEKRGSAGRPTPGTKLRVVDPDKGTVLAIGEHGVLEVQSPQISTDPNHWTRTTDLASLDSDGFLFIHGRADDAVIRGGFKIVPSVVEEALRLHPSVADAAMAGIAHERLGAVPVAAVTLHVGAAVPTDGELLAWLRERLARYQIPVAIKVVAELPRTPSMKVSRPALREMFADLELGD